MIFQCRSSGLARILSEDLLNENLWRSFFYETVTISRARDGGAQFHMRELGIFYFSFISSVVSSSDVWHVRACSSSIVVRLSSAWLAATKELHTRQ